MVTYNDDNKNDNEDKDKKEKDNKDNNNSDLGDSFWDYQGDDPNAYQQTAKGKVTLTLIMWNKRQIILS